MSDTTRTSATPGLAHHNDQVIPVRCGRDGLTHLVPDAALAHQRADDCLARCGHRVLPAALTTPDARTCRACRATDLSRGPAR